MSITARSGLLLAAATAGLALIPAAAIAQDGGVVLNILVECAKIDDPSARLACYDNNIRAAGGQARNTVPGALRGVTGGGAPVVSSGNTGGAAGFGGDDLRGAVASADSRPEMRRSDGSFGNEDIRSQDRFEDPAGPQVIIATVARAQEREPGVFVMTMQDDTQWAFSEATRNSFRAPRVGSKVEISRGSLGSYLARVDNQEGIRVRRLR